MKWISVEERLPPNDIGILIAEYDGREKVKMHFINIGRRINNYWFSGDNDEEIKKNIVTHWMPLPDVPGKFIDD